MWWNDPNKPERHRLPRADEPRELGPSGTGDLAHDGYWVRVRRPRIAGYPDMVSPERASQMETTVMEYDDLMTDDF